RRPGPGGGPVGAPADPAVVGRPVVHRLPRRVHRRGLLPPFHPGPSRRAAVLRPHHPGRDGLGARLFRAHPPGRRRALRRRHRGDHRRPPALLRPPRRPDALLDGRRGGAGGSGPGGGGAAGVRRGDGVDLRTPALCYTTFEDHVAAWEACARGEIAERLPMITIIPTGADPTQAPDGQDTVWSWTGIAAGRPTQPWSEVGAAVAE